MSTRTARDLLKLLEGKRLLIFDFDGTLADTSEFHEAAFNAVLTPWGIRVNYPAIAGLRTHDALVASLSAAGLTLLESDLRELALSKQACVREMIKEGLRSLPGVDEFLRWARPRFRLALYSSGSRGTVSLAMEKLGYTGWFDPLLCAEDVGRAKPDPEGFLKVLSMTGMNAEIAIAFEDSSAGLEAAQRAGLMFHDVRTVSFDDLHLD